MHPQRKWNHDICRKIDTTICHYDKWKKNRFWKINTACFPSYTVSKFVWGEGVGRRTTTRKKEEILKECWGELWNICDLKAENTNLGRKGTITRWLVTSKKKKRQICTKMQQWRPLLCKLTLKIILKHFLLSLAHWISVILPTCAFSLTQET